MIAFWNEDKCPIKFHVRRCFVRCSRRRGQANSEVFDTTSAFNISRSNNSLAVLKQTVSLLLRKRDVYSVVFD